MIHDAARKDGAPILGLRPGNGQPGPFGFASGFGIDDDPGQEVAGISRSVDEATAVGIVQSRPSPRSSSSTSGSGIIGPSRACSDMS